MDARPRIRPEILGSRGTSRDLPVKEYMESPLRRTPAFGTVGGPAQFDAAADQRKPGAHGGTRPGLVVASSDRWARGLRVALVASDTAVVALSLLYAQVVRFGVSPSQALKNSDKYTWLSIGIAALWLLMLAVFRSRTTRHLGAGSQEYQRVARATFSTFGLIAVVALLLKLDIARGYLLIALPVGIVGLLLDRMVWRSWLVAHRREGRCLTGAFVVGNHQDASRVVRQLLQQHRAGYKPVGVAFTDGAGRATSAVVEDHRVPLVSVDDVPKLTRATGTRAVIVAGNLPGGREQVQDLGWQLENSGTELILVSSLTDVAGPRIHMRPVEGLPMLHVDLPQYEGVNHTIKRAIDLLLGGLAVFLLSPVLAVVALAVKLDSPGPVLFRQERVGVAGRSFTMFKFRSMVVGAEADLESLKGSNEGSGLLFKLRHDPRVTRVGRTIRRYSLDELPQLFNVLNGSMSLIGPRPPLPHEVAEYEGRVHRRLLIKPGITGLWQVSGRSNLSWEESVKLDLYYVENWSIMSDFVVLLKTVRAVFKHDGAY
jgi:exopolysaccharide biosynthesis polyprenyl glycosylphosphotransferase